MNRRETLCLALTLIGCLQMVAGLAGSRALRGVAAAWGVSPYPRVFSDVEGLETFASAFALHYRRGDDPAWHSVPITPELYSRLQGPYARRNAYGAALAYAPRLPDALWRGPYCYGLGPGGPLRRELGIPEGAGAVRVEIRTRTRGRSDAWTLIPVCP